MLTMNLCQTTRLDLIELADIHAVVEWFYGELQLA